MRTYESIGRSELESPDRGALQHPPVRGSVPTQRLAHTDPRVPRHAAHPLVRAVSSPSRQWSTRHIGVTMNAAVLKPQAAQDCAIADLSLAEWGRREIRIAETEMPGLMAIREEFAKSQPL